MSNVTEKLIDTKLLVLVAVFATHSENITKNEANRGEITKTSSKMNS